MIFFGSQHLKTNVWVLFCFFSEHAHSLIAPVEPDGDVPLDLTSLVLGEMALDQLPTQVDELVHHMTQLVEQIHLVFLLKEAKKT